VNAFRRESSMKSTTIMVAVGALAVASVLAACSDEKAAATASPVAQASEPAQRQAAAPTQSRSAAGKGESGKAGQGDCDLLSAAELEAAFDGRLSFGRMSGRGPRGRGCTVVLGGDVEGQLIMQAGNRAAFETRKQSYSGQSSVRMEPVDLGVEAYRVNDYQIIVDAGDDRSLSLGLQVFFLGDSAPITAGEGAAGVEALTRQALARLTASASE